MLILEAKTLQHNYVHNKLLRQLLIGFIAMGKLFIFCKGFGMKYILGLLVVTDKIKTHHFILCVGKQSLGFH